MKETEAIFILMSRKSLFL